MNRYRDDDKSSAPMPDSDIISPRAHKISRRGIIIAICLIAVSGILFSLCSPFWSPYTPGTNVSSPSDGDGNDRESEPMDPFEPLKRYSLKYNKVACWENNGVWIKSLSPVEQSSLGLNRFHDTERATNEHEEEEFCAKLRLYGASFWSLPPKWHRAKGMEHVVWCESIDCVEPDLQVNLTLAYPKSGGVWFLDHGEGHNHSPWSTGLGNASTMEERVQVIKDLSGKFCETIQACPEMTALVSPIILPPNWDEDEGLFDALDDVFSVLRTLSAGYLRYAFI